MPQAFVSAMRGDDEQQFRRQCIEALTRSEALDFMIDQLKAIAISTSRLAQQVALPATDSTAAVPTTATTASGDEA